MSIQFLPKKQSLRAIVEPIIDAFENYRKERHELTEFDWLDDYTKAELLQIGFCLGGNLKGNACGSIVMGNTSFEVTDQIHQWFFGLKTQQKDGAKSASWYLVRGEYKVVLDELNEMDNVWAICAAMLIASESPSHVPKLIERIIQQIEDGVEETCF